MRFGTIILFTVLWLSSHAQQPQTVSKSDTTAEINLKWINELSEMGIEQKDDSLFIREEMIRLISDSAYRRSIYPEKYEWPLVVSLLKQMEFKKAFWHLINIYSEDSASKNMVIGIFLQYDSLMQMDKILINTFYTYALTDPRVCRITNGKPNFFRPDLLEKNLSVTKEMINVIVYYRKEKLKSPK